jgi:hypothetical protein
MLRADTVTLLVNLRVMVVVVVGMRVATASAQSQWTTRRGRRSLRWWEMETRLYLTMERRNYKLKGSSW